MVPRHEEDPLAKLSRRELATYVETQAATQQVSITSKDGTAHQVDVPENALLQLVDILTGLGEGNTGKLIPVHAEMTTQEAVELMNMSRPTFIKLLDDGKMPFHHVGNRRKVKYMDVMPYKQNLVQQWLQTLDELTELDQSLGIGY